MTWLQTFSQYKFFHAISTAVLVLCYLYFLINHATMIKGGAVTPALLIFVAMETIVVSLLLIRREPVVRSTHNLAWLFAIVGTFSPLLLIPSSTEVHRLLGDTLLVLGGLLAIGSYLSLNASFGITPALRAIRTTGLYAIVRHPMYLSYTVLYLGYLLVAFSYYNVAILGCMLICMIMRIHYEEALLETDPTYQAYRQKVSARLVPFIY